MGKAAAPAAFHWSRGPIRAALAPLAGAAMALAFPGAGIWGLAPVAVAVFLALATTATPRRAAQEGFFFGFVFFGILLRWFAAVLLDFTNLGGALAFAAVVAAGIAMGLFTAGLAWILGRLRCRWNQGTVLFVGAFLWVGLEVVREWFPVSFPWGNLGAAWTPAPFSWAVAMVIGARGLSLFLALGAALLAAWLTGERKMARRGLLVWVALGGGIVIAGQRIDAALPLTTPVRVAVLQASLGDTTGELDKLLAYEKLTREAARLGARLVVWPESAVRFRIDSDTDFRVRIEQLARTQGVDIVLNSVTSVPGGGYFNSDVLVRPDRGLAEIQPKRQLVPFGEYLPLRPLLGKIPAIAWEMGEDFRRAKAPVVLRGQSASVGALVCYEAVFPGLAGDLARSGAGFLVTTTNDSWFGWSDGPAQHLQHTLLRTAETGRPLLRAALSGISALVDRRGVVRQRMDLGDKGLLVDDLRPGGAVPPGAALGKAVAVVCGIVLAAAVAAAFFFARKPCPPPLAQTESEHAG